MKTESQVRAELESAIAKFNALPTPDEIYLRLTTPSLPSDEAVGLIAISRMAQCLSGRIEALAWVLGVHLESGPRSTVVN